MKYITPEVGTILPAQENDGIENPGPTGNITRWLQAQAQDEAFARNKIKVIDYLSYFTNSWLVDYRAGRVHGPTGITGDPYAVPPRPPNGYAVVVEAAEAGGVVFTPTDGAGPMVCAVPQYDKIPPPQH